MAETMLFWFICAIVGGLLGVAGLLLFCTGNDDYPRSLKRAWTECPRYRAAAICTLLGLLIAFAGGVSLLSV